MSTPPELPPAAQMLNMCWGFQMSQAVYVAAKLNIPDILEAGPMPVSKIAELAGAHPPYLARLMRTLCALGVFKFDPSKPDVFENTPLSLALSSTHPGSVRNACVSWSETHYQPFGKLLDVVKGDGSTTGPELAYGKPFWDYLDELPEQRATFASAMADATELRNPTIDAFDPNLASEKGAVIADIGGGNGSVLAKLLKSRPNARGIVFDREGTLVEAAKKMKEEGLDDRVSLQGGDFLESVPEGADVYILGFILHDWSDEFSAKILRNIRRVMKPTSTIAILECVVPDSNEMHLSKMLDITMLGMLNGLERTAAEYKSLLANCGLAMTKVQGAASPFSWVYAIADNHVQ